MENEKKILLLSEIVDVDYMGVKVWNSLSNNNLETSKQVSNLEANEEYLNSMYSTRPLCSISYDVQNIESNKPLDLLENEIYNY